MAITTGSFSSGLSDVGLSSGAPNTSEDSSPKAGGPVGDFGAYPVLPGDNSNATAPENKLDYMNLDA